MNVDSGQISHILLAAAVILMIILITRLFSGFIGQTAVLISIIIGCFIAWPMGLMKFTGVGSAKWFGISPPFHFGHPKFEAAAIISMCIVVLVTYTESTADMLAVSEMVDKKLSPSDLARGLATDGLSALLAGFMNSFPDTAYAENVGLIAMTKVRSRWVVTVCGAALIILGLVPKVGAVVADLPSPVIGGAATVMFALVTAIGIKTLNKASFDGNHNLLIVAVALSFGLIPVIQPVLLHALPAELPGHLRLQHHLDGDRGLHPEPGVQPLAPVPARARGRGRNRPGLRRGRARSGPRPRPGAQLLTLRPARTSRTLARARVLKITDCRVASLSGR